MHEWAPKTPVWSQMWKKEFNLIIRNTVLAGQLLWDNSGSQESPRKAFKAKVSISTPNPSSLRCWGSIFFKQPFSWLWEVWRVFLCSAQELVPFLAKLGSGKAGEDVPPSHRESGGRSAFEYPQGCCPGHWHFRPPWNTPEQRKCPVI